MFADVFLALEGKCSGNTYTGNIIWNTFKSNQWPCLSAIHFFKADLVQSPSSTVGYTEPFQISGSSAVRSLLWFCFVHTSQLGQVLVCLVIKYISSLLVTVYHVLGKAKTVFNLFFSITIHKLISPPLLCVSSEHWICGWDYKGEGCL